jgi:hypothetical protein
MLASFQMSRQFSTAGNLNKSARIPQTRESQQPKFWRAQPDVCTLILHIILHQVSCSGADVVQKETGDALGRQMGQDARRHATN